MGHRMRVLVPPIALLLLAIYPASTFIPGADGPVSRQVALEGGNTTFHCDSTPESAEDELMLLVWYKDNVPIYSYDARIHSEWSNESFNFSGRLKVDITKQPTELTIDKLADGDQALYHCRVDFTVSQTRNLGVDLAIIVLPSKPFVLDEMGNKVGDKIGPYHDGDTLVLSCLVIGGRPPPRIQWFSNNTLVDDTDGPSDIPNVKENLLYLPLNRDHTGPLECRATNTELTSSVNTTLDIELYLPPQTVSIHFLQGSTGIGTLQAGVPALVKCEADGSNPVAELTWWLGHEHLTHHSNQSTNSTTGTTVSYLELNPVANDHEATLSCLATNIAMAQSRGSKADLIKLNVTYSPNVEVSMVSKGNMEELLEQDPLHLDCEVTANPPAHQITWYCNNTKILSGDIWGHNTSGTSLIVEKASRHHSGKYSCAATNTMGETRAPEINVTVLYPPECTEDGVTLSLETISCNVRALPAPDTFFWHVQPVDFDVQHMTTGSPLLPLSQISGPLSGRIHVSCEAGNGVASQEKACEATLSVEHLRPSQPMQCDLAYEREEFQIRCLPVENATYYEVTVWKLSKTNSSLVLERRGSMGWGVGSQALPHASEVPWLIRGALGKLGPGDEAGAAACNRYGCSVAMLLRPSDNLLRAAAPPWWHLFLEKDFVMSVGAVVLVVAFILSTVLALRIARRPRSKAPAPVVQVLQLDDVAREYIDHALVHKRHVSCSVRSCSSGYSGGSQELEPPPVERQRKPIYYWEPGPPPDVTLTLHRESAV